MVRFVNITFTRILQILSFIRKNNTNPKNQPINPSKTRTTTPAKADCYTAGHDPHPLFSEVRSGWDLRMAETPKGLVRYEGFSSCKTNTVLIKIKKKIHIYFVLINIFYQISKTYTSCVADITFLNLY